MNSGNTTILNYGLGLLMPVLPTYTTMVGGVKTGGALDFCLNTGAGFKMTICQAGYQGYCRMGRHRVRFL